MIIKNTDICIFGEHRNKNNVKRTHVNECSNVCSQRYFPLFAIYSWKHDERQYCKTFSMCFFSCFLIILNGFCCFGLSFFYRKTTQFSQSPVCFCFNSRQNYNIFILNFLLQISEIDKHRDFSFMCICCIFHVLWAPDNTNL